jgi:hypothetical protein
VKKGQVRVWSGATRARLFKLYGKQHEIAKCFPDPEQIPQDVDPAQVLAERMVWVADS